MDTRPQKEPSLDAAVPMSVWKDSKPGQHLDGLYAHRAGATASFSSIVGRHRSTLAHSLVASCSMWLAALAGTLLTHTPHPSVPRDARFALSSLATGKLLQHSIVPPLHAGFGAQPANVTGEVVHPPVDGLCTWRPEMSMFTNRLVLGGDWTSGGCSIEERSRVLTAAGAAAAIFVGTWGLPLDWDGSDVTSITIPVIVLPKSVYRDVTEAMTMNHSADVETMSGFLSKPPPSDIVLWLVPAETPLLHDAAFRAFDRTMQVLFFIAVFVNIFLALDQLWRFHVAAKRLQSTKKKLKADAAIRVISLELISALGMTLFIVDGPGMEHTRPAVLPWFVHRLALGIQVEFHMLALLVSSSHLRQIRKRVAAAMTNTKLDTQTNTKPIAFATTPDEGSFTNRVVRASQQRLSVSVPGRRGSVGGRRESIGIGDVTDGSASETSRAGCRCACAVLQVSSRYDGFTIALLLVLIVMDNVLAVLTGLYLASDDATFIASSYITFVTIGIGSWFIWQSMVIIAKLKNANSTSSHRRVSHLSRNVRAIGTLLIVANIVGTASEVVVRPMLGEVGGWTYWWTMYPFWCAMEFLLLLNTTLQILAFQPPQTTSPSDTTTEKPRGRHSVSSAILNDVVTTLKGRGHGRDDKGPVRQSMRDSKIGPADPADPDQSATFRNLQGLSNTSSEHAVDLRGSNASSFGGGEASVA